MRIIRMWLWSTVAVLILTCVAWSLFILFFQIVFSSVARSERPLREAFSPVHVGYGGHAVPLPKPGIPLETNRAPSIGGRDLAEWLQQAKDVRPATPVLSDLPSVANVRLGPNLCEAPWLRGKADYMLPVGANGQRLLILIIPIAPECPVLCSH